MLNIQRYINKGIGLFACILFAGAAAAQTPDADTTIVVTKTPAKGVPLTGTVTDAATNKPAAGVRISVENFSAAISDSTGSFKINVPGYNSVVLFEGEGYDTRRVPLKGRKKLNLFLLDERVESFHEQVNMPFGLRTKKYVTAAVGQYNVDGFKNPNETVDGILQGNISGLNATRRSGTQGAGANLFLRGINSLYATNQPLIVVDGMLYDARDYGQSIIANNYTNPLALIDIKDIDNITVVKDAASMYGTKGANGAILVTTARAVSEATKIDFAVYSGFNKTPTSLPLMNATDFRIYLSDVLQSRGLTPAQVSAEPYMNDDPSNPAYAQYHNNTRWQDQVFKNSRTQNVYLKVTGGDNIAKYGLTLGYVKNDGIIQNTDFKRYNTRFNAVFNFTRRFTGTTNLSFSYNEQELKDQGIADKTAPLFNALVKAPFLGTNEVNDKGVISPNLADRDTLGFSNPSVLIANMKGSNKYYRFFGSFGFNYEISKYVNASTLIGVVYDKVRESIFMPRKGIVDDTLRNAVVDSRLGSQVKRLFSINSDTKLEYKRIYDRTHAVAARVGFRYQTNKAEQDFALGYNSATDNLISIQNGVAALRQVGGDMGDWNWMNLYAGADYGFKEKLFLNFSMAMDGSSRFGKEASNGLTLGGYKFPVMPSLGAAWLISSENFMAGSGIDLLKLRASYSITGNDDIGNYSARHTYVSQNLLGAQGLVRKGIANPGLQWETSRKLNAGLDFSFLNERVFISLDGYQSTTDNMLVYQPITPVSGFSSILTNGGKMKNTGIDASLNIRVINGANFKWDAGINAGTYKNEIIAVPNDKILTQYAGATIITQVGGDANQFYGFKTNGVYTSNAEAAGSGLSNKNADGSVTAFTGGDMRFVDMDGNKVIDDNDRTVIGNPNPELTGGFSNRFYYKGFELNALFTFSQGNDLYNYVRYRLEAGSSYENQLLSVNNRWRGDGQITNTPKVMYGDPTGNSRFSDRWIEDGSYFRLRTLSLQYNFPLKARGALKSAAIYATANNLFTLTEYKGYDPEFSATSSVFGQGVDTGLDPLYKTVTLGVKIGL